MAKSAVTHLSLVYGLEKPCPLCSAPTAIEWPLCLDVTGHEDRVRSILAKYGSSTCANGHDVRLVLPRSLLFRDRTPVLVWLSDAASASFPDADELQTHEANIRNTVQERVAAWSAVPPDVAAFLASDTFGGFIYAPLLELALEPGNHTAISAISAAVKEILETLTSEDSGIIEAAMTDGQWLADAAKRLVDLSQPFSFEDDAALLVQTAVARAAFAGKEWAIAAEYGKRALAFVNVAADKLTAARSAQLQAANLELRHEVAFALCECDRLTEAIDVLEEATVIGLARTAKARKIAEKLRKSRALHREDIDSVDHAAKMVCLAESEFIAMDGDSLKDLTAIEVRDGLDAQHLRGREAAFLNFTAHMMMFDKMHPGRLEPATVLEGSHHDLFDALGENDVIAYLAHTQRTGFALVTARAADGQIALGKVDIPSFSSGRLWDVLYGSAQDPASGYYTAYERRSKDPDAWRDAIITIGKFLAGAVRPVVGFANHFNKRAIRLICLGRTANLPYSAALEISDAGIGLLGIEVPLAYGLNAASLAGSKQREAVRGRSLFLVCGDDPPPAAVSEAVLVSRSFDHARSFHDRPPLRGATAPRQPQPKRPFADFKAIANPLERVKSWLRHGDLRDEPMDDSAKAFFAAQQDYEAAAREVLAGIETADTVHIASHAYGDVDRPLYSGISLGGGHLLLARHVLSMAAYMGGGRLAVLSGCETGLSGTSTPQEATGFSKAFLLGGYAGVLASAWEVDDVATAALMIRFYECWLEQNLAPNLALHKAQQFLLATSNSRLVAYFKAVVNHSPAYAKASATGLMHVFALGEPETRPYTHPFYWAGFYLIGH